MKINKVMLITLFLLGLGCLFYLSDFVGMVMSMIVIFLLLVVTVEE